MRETWRFHVIAPIIGCGAPGTAKDAPRTAARTMRSGFMARKIVLQPGRKGHTGRARRLPGLRGARERGALAGARAQDASVPRRRSRKSSSSARSTRASARRRRATASAAAAAPRWSPKSPTFASFPSPSRARPRRCGRTSPRACVSRCAIPGKTTSSVSSRSSTTRRCTCSSSARTSSTSCTAIRSGTATASSCPSVCRRPVTIACSPTSLPEAATPQLATKSPFVAGGRMQPRELDPDYSSKQAENLRVELDVLPSEPVARAPVTLRFTVAPEAGLELYVGAPAHLFLARGPHRSRARAPAGHCAERDGQFLGLVPARDDLSRLGAVPAGGRRQHGALRHTRSLGRAVGRL